MARNKKGLAAVNDQAQSLYDRYTASLMRLAALLMAFPEIAIMAAVIAFTTGLMLTRLWGVA